MNERIGFDILEGTMNVPVRVTIEEVVDLESGVHTWVSLIKSLGDGAFLSAGSFSSKELCTQKLKDEGFVPSKPKVMIITDATTETK